MESAKILLLGKTGAGKSSFINYFLGTDAAQTGVGLPVTQEIFKPYKIDGDPYPIEIFDTKGIETFGAKNQTDELLNEIKLRNTSDNVFDWFHTIFYCVSMADPRFEDFDANFINRLTEELSQRVHIIITNCDYEPENVEKMRAAIREKLNGAPNQR